MNFLERINNYRVIRKEQPNQKDTTPVQDLDQKVVSAVTWTMITKFYDAQSEKFLDHIQSQVNFWRQERMLDEDGDKRDISDIFIQYLGCYQDGCYGTYSDEFRMAFEGTCLKHKISSPLEFQSKFDFEPQTRRNNMERIQNQENITRGIITDQLYMYFSKRQNPQNQSLSLDELLKSQN